MYVCMYACRVTCVHVLRYVYGCVYIYTHVGIFLLLTHVFAFTFMYIPYGCIYRQTCNMNTSRVKLYPYFSMCIKQIYYKCVCIYIYISI